MGLQRREAEGFVEFCCTACTSTADADTDRAGTGVRGGVVVIVVLVDRVVVCWCDGDRNAAGGTRRWWHCRDWAAVVGVGLLLLVVVGAR